MAGGNFLLHTADGQLLIVDPTIPTFSRSEKAFRGKYFAALSDIAGQTSAYVFFALFNPVGSSVFATVSRATVMGYAQTQNITKTSMRLSRISASSGGTLINTTAIARRHPSMFAGAQPGGNTKMQLRSTGVTVTQVADFASFAPPIVFETPTPTTAYIAKENTVRPRDGDEEIILAEGQGLCWYTSAAGDVDATHDFRFAWGEYLNDPVMGL